MDVNNECFEISPPAVAWYVNYERPLRTRAVLYLEYVITLLYAKMFVAT